MTQLWPGSPQHVQSKRWIFLHTRSRPYTKVISYPCTCAEYEMNFPAHAQYRLHARIPHMRRDYAGLVGDTATPLLHRAEVSPVLSHTNQTLWLERMQMYKFTVVLLSAGNILHHQRRVTSAVLQASQSTVSNSLHFKKCKTQTNKQTKHATNLSYEHTTLVVFLRDRQAEMT